MKPELAPFNNLFLDSNISLYAVDKASVIQN